ncbi:uncharacterized protein LOC131662917 [Phymastichus coffea]|uniref:uncharacterized protein LOC131662917 n=1 Tax=Phymastichus coffea TaxID=108790 RepID=UPI00273C0AD7|nr:uncharacterized protein LOC131662917 [Phymastichus coffea]
MDVLQSLPVDKWSSLLDLLKRDWPAYAYYHNHVNNSIKWKAKEPSVKIDFYCPHGTTDAGVFISIAGGARISLVVFAFDESKDILQEVLRKTRRINWSESLIFACVHEGILGVLKNFLETAGRSKGCVSYKSLDNYCYFLSKEHCSKIKVKVPEECELKRIDETFVPLIHSLWPHRDTRHPEKTLGFLTEIARLNGGYGLFSKQDHSLLAWIFQCSIGGLGILQTLDEHKRKGYGKCVAQAQAKYLAETEGLDVTLFVIQSNLPSQSLFESMGFKRVAAPAWVYANP